MNVNDELSWCNVCNVVVVYTWKWGLCIDAVTLSAAWHAFRDGPDLWHTKLPCIDPFVHRDADALKAAAHIK